MLVRLARFGIKTRNAVPNVVAWESCALINRAGKETSAQWAERNKANPKFLQRWQNFLLRFSPPQGILALECGDGLNCMGTADGLRTRLRHAKVLDLAFPDKFLYRAGNVFDWNLQVNAMLIEEIQSIHFQTLERCLGHLPDVLGAAVGGIPLAAVGWIGLEAKLGRDHNLSTKRGQSFADQFLIHQRTIGLGRIEKGDTALYRSANYLDSFFFLRRWTKAGTQPHAAKAQR